MKKFAVIVAGGNGSRMNSELPKQFIHLHQKPIMAYTINQFLAVGCEIIVVLPKEHFGTFKQEILHHCHSQEMTLAQGGQTRFHSVKNGLDTIFEPGLVAVHDAVRPFVSLELIQESFSTAQKKTNAIAAVGLKDSIRRLTPSGSQSKNRAEYQLIQTPQTFQTELLLEAYNQPYRDEFTDDASVFEHAGHQIHLIPGSYKNIKITTPEDLLVAKAFLDEKI